jgi:hypothetical protein
MIGVVFGSVLHQSWLLSSHGKGLAMALFVPPINASNKKKICDLIGLPCLCRVSETRTLQNGRSCGVAPVPRVTHGKLGELNVSRLKSREIKRIQENSRENSRSFGGLNKQMIANYDVIAAVRCGHAPSKWRAPHSKQLRRSPFAAESPRFVEAGKLCRIQRQRFTSLALL